MSRRQPAIRISERDVVFENSDYIAVAKRRGWPVHRTLDPGRPNLFDSLKGYLQRRSEGEAYIALHHRLDVWTSGVVLFAKSKRANPVLADLFAGRGARKTYEAICVGQPPEPEGELTHFLAKKRIGKVERMVPVRAGGQKAITRYRVLETSGALCRVAFELVTGRMHQLRAQSAAAGFPILGDPLYGDAGANRRYGLGHQLLHARSLSFVDPLSGQALDVEAPLPDDMVAFPACGGATRGARAGDRVGKGHRYLLFHKPYGVLCQFTREQESDRCLADFDLPKDVYPVGRLDKDSEGLVLLTDDGAAKHRLANPKHETEKTYWVQVEGEPSAKALAELGAGVTIQGYRTKPCKVRLLDPEPALPPRDPPIRERKSIPTAWLEIILTEGKNRQVRRMTAAVGLPTLRLVRVAIGKLALDNLDPGQSRDVGDPRD